MESPLGHPSKTSLNTWTFFPSMLARDIFAGLSHSEKKIKPLLGWTTIARGLFKLDRRIRL